MPIAIVFIQGLFELVGLCSFFVGYFADIWWLMIVGGCLVILDDVIEISMGILNPLFPVIFATFDGIKVGEWSEQVGENSKNRLALSLGYYGARSTFGKHV